MGIKYSLPVDGIPNLAQKKQALVTDATSGDADMQTSIASVIDCLQAFGMVATV